MDTAQGEAFQGLVRLDSNGLANVLGSLVAGSQTSDKAIDLLRGAVKNLGEDMSDVKDKLQNLDVAALSIMAMQMRSFSDDMKNIRNDIRLAITLGRKMKGVSDLVEGFEVRINAVEDSAVEAANVVKQTEGRLELRMKSIEDMIRGLEQTMGSRVDVNRNTSRHDVIEFQLTQMRKSVQEMRTELRDTLAGLAENTADADAGGVATTPPMTKDKEPSARHARARSLLKADTGTTGGGDSSNIDGGMIFDANESEASGGGGRKGKSINRTSKGHKRRGSHVRRRSGVSSSAATTKAIEEAAESARRDAAREKEELIARLKRQEARMRRMLEIQGKDDQSRLKELESQLLQQSDESERLQEDNAAMEKTVRQVKEGMAQQAREMTRLQGIIESTRALYESKLQAGAGQQSNLGSGHAAVAELSQLLGNVQQESSEARVAMEERITELMASVAVMKNQLAERNEEDALVALSVVTKKDPVVDAYAHLKSNNVSERNSSAAVQFDRTSYEARLNRVVQKSCDVALGGLSSRLVQVEGALKILQRRPSRRFSVTAVPVAGEPSDQRRKPRPALDSSESDSQQAPVASPAGKARSAAVALRKAAHQSSVEEQSKGASGRKRGMNDSKSASKHHNGTAASEIASVDSTLPRVGSTIVAVSGEPIISRVERLNNRQRSIRHLVSQLSHKIEAVETMMEKLMIMANSAADGGAVRSVLNIVQVKQSASVMGGAGNALRPKRMLDQHGRHPAGVRSSAKESLIYGQTVIAGTALRASQQSAVQGVRSSVAPPARRASIQEPTERHDLSATGHRTRIYEAKQKATNATDVLQEGASKKGSTPQAHLPEPEAFHGAEEKPSGAFFGGGFREDPRGWSTHLKKIPIELLNSNSGGEGSVDDQRVARAEEAGMAALHSRGALHTSDGKVMSSPVEIGDARSAAKQEEGNMDGGIADKYVEVQRGANSVSSLRLPSIVVSGHRVTKPTSEGGKLDSAARRKGEISHRGASDSGGHIETSVSGSCDGGMFDSKGHASGHHAAPHHSISSRTDAGAQHGAPTKNRFGPQFGGEDQSLSVEEEYIQLLKLLPGKRKGMKGRHGLSVDTYGRPDGRRGSHGDTSRQGDVAAWNTAGL